MDQTPMWNWMSQNLDREILFNLQKILQHLISFEESFNDFKTWCATESAAIRQEMATQSANEVNAINWVKTSVDSNRTVINTLKWELESYISNTTEYQRSVLQRLNNHNM